MTPWEETALGSMSMSSAVDSTGNASIFCAFPNEFVHFLQIEEVIDEAVEFAVELADASPHPERTQMLQNVFPDPKGFEIGPDGEYRYKDPAFTAGTAAV
jgi:hypothetical protein